MCEKIGTAKPKTLHLLRFKFELFTLTLPKVFGFFKELLEVLGITRTPAEVLNCSHRTPFH